MSEKFKVVISGISGRFPECDRVDCFREKLYNGDDFITIDDRKWPVGYRYKLNEKQIPDATGKLKNYQNLDNVVFKLKQATALSTDITSRLAWEPAFEAIIDAGVNPYSLDGSNVGVFMSLNFSEVSEHSFDDTGPICLLLGSNKTMLSNRLSFALNLKGPSFTNFIDMHGGMESLALGYKHVSEGFADSAIVGVSSCFKDPRVSLHFIGPGLLSPDGKTRTFDDRANGYGRSDAVVCFYLQRAHEAKRSYGELVFCDFHYHGSDLSTLIGCDEKYLQISLDEIYRRNGFLGNLPDIAYVEMNAYGLKKMDKIESNAVARFFNRDQDHPLMVGSIKSNVGHTEGAAGLMAVLKAILTLDSGTVAPNLHLSKINSDVQSLKENKLKVVQELTKLNGHTIAVNSLGLFGSVGHAVIKKSQSRTEPKADEEDKSPRLLLVSGRVENDLRDVIKKIETVPYSPEFVALVNDSLGQYLPHHLYRGYTILPKSIKTINDVQVRGAENRPIWFIFSGMGSQWHGMGDGLLELPVFAETVAKCDRVLKPKGIDIYHILTSNDPTMFDSIINSFVAITTMQVALFEVLKALGIEPDCIIGHSHGENSCGYADGCLSLEETMLVSWTRGLHSMEMNTIKGMMAAVGKGYDDIKDSLPEGVEVACHNSAQSCTLSGPEEKVNAFVNELKSDGVTFAKAVDVSNIAFHSSYISSTGPTLTARLKEIIRMPKQRSARWISTSVPESEWNSELAQYCSAEYLTNNFVNPVLFEEGCKHIPANAVCIELAPHGLLQAILRKSLPDTCANVSLTQRSKMKENLNVLLGAVGKLYVAGLEVQANNLFAKVDYPVPRGTPSVSPFCTWYHDPADVLPRFLIPNLFFPLSNESISISIKEGSEYAYLGGHKVNNDILIPPSFFMYLTWWIFSYQRKEELGSVAVVFENVHMKENLTISVQNTISVLIMVQHGTGDFEVILDDAKLKTGNSKPSILMTGTIYALTGLRKTKVDRADDRSLDQMSLLLTRDQLYEAFKHSGYQLEDSFRLLQNVYKRANDYHGEIMWNRNWVTFIDSLMKFQMIALHGGKVDSFYARRVRQVKIPAPQFSTLEKGKILICEASTATRTLHCNGIEMCNLYSERVVVEENYEVMQYQFVSYANPKCQNIYEFITLCLQIAVESLSMFKNVDELVIIETTKSDKLGLSSVVQHVVNCKDGMKPSVRMHSASDRALKIKSHNKSLLILADSVEYVREFDLADNVFILALSPFDLNSESNLRDGYLEITKQSFLDCTITLLQKKRCQRINSIVLFDNGELRNGNGVHEGDRVRGSEENNMYCIVRQNVELSDLLEMLTVTKDHFQERYVYIMDEETDMYELNTSIEHQMELNLPALIFKQGEWGCYRNLSLARQGSDDEGLYTKVASSLANFEFGFEDDSAYVSVLSGPVNTSDRSAVVGFAYAGFKSSSEKIAGLGQTSISGAAECDPYLVWRVPSEWSWEDAVTIPYIYVQACNLFCPPMYRSSEAKSALINMGSEYTLTEAFVTLALHKKLKNLFVTVTNDEEVDLIQRKFPQLQSSQILRHDNQSYALEIYQHAERGGVDLVVNCLPGIDHVTASLSCATDQGHYIEAEMKNLTATNELGLYAFLKSVSFLVMRKNVSDLLQLPSEIKLKLKNTIQECIDKGVINPPEIGQRDTEALSTVRPGNVKIVKYAPAAKKPLHSTPAAIKYDDEHSYLIIGEKANACLELLEWLVTKGARKFIVCLQTLSRASDISTRITRLREQTKATVVLTSLSRLEDVESAEQLYQETRKIAPVEAVFFVSVAGVSATFSNVDAVVASSVHFVGISSGRLNDYERRRSRGCPTTLIHGDQPAKLSFLLPLLDNLSALDGGSGAAVVLYQVTNKNASVKKKEKKKFALREYLPTDLDLLSRITRESSGDAAFVEAISLSRKYRDCKGVYPIFVLPALHTDLLQPLYQRLHYPVFAAVNFDTSSVTYTARKLFDLLNVIQPSGPVTLISEMWHLPLALELVNLVQKAGRTFKVFAIEGNPQDWKERVAYLGPAKSKQFDQRLVENIFHFNSNVRTCNIYDDVAFEDRVRDGAKEMLKDSPAVVENIVNAAELVRNKICNVARLQFNDKVLNHVIFLERKQPDDKSLKLSISSDVVVLEVATYQDLLKHPETCRTINENAVFDWWGFPDTKE